jgi:hypothetical protein
VDNKNINNLFEVLTPKEEQKERMFSEILKTSKIENLKQPRTSKSLFNFHLRKKGLSALIACTLCFIICFGILSFTGSKTAFTVYAYGDNTEINNTGVELSTGMISDTGEMHGQLLSMYVNGKNIDTIRYSCKNQYISFTDWTQNRENYSMEKSFTVPYGNNSSDYKYLVINWEPDKTIRTLTDHKDVGIAGLSDNLRYDIIVMQIIFNDKTSIIKAIEVELQDTGKFFARLVDYTISDKDDFVLNPEKKTQTPPPQPTNETNNSNSTKYSDFEIDAAKKIAEAHYANFTGSQKIVSIEYTEKSELLNNALSGKYEGWQLIAFKAYEKDQYPDIYRTILLGRKDEEQNWTVINEGY